MSFEHYIARAFSCFYTTEEEEAPSKRLVFSYLFNTYFDKIVIYSIGCVAQVFSNFEWTPRNASSSSIMTTQRATSFSFPSQVANLNGKLTATQTTLTTRDQELREKETEVGNVFKTRKAVLSVGRRSRNSYFIYYTTWELLQFDWLRAVAFQLNLKYLHVKITNLLRVVV